MNATDITRMNPRGPSGLPQLLIWLACALCLLPVQVFAARGYIREMVNITLRSGPGNRFKVLDMLETGQEVDTIRRNEDGWTLVEIPGGKQGWVLSRFITREAPSALQLKKLEKAHAELLTRIDPLQAENELLQAENLRLREKLATIQADNDRLAEEVARLKQAETALTELNRAHADLQEEMAAVKKQSELYEKKAKSPFMQPEMKWFLIGAGVILTGFFVGFSVRPKKRKSSLL